MSFPFFSCRLILLLMLETDVLLEQVQNRIKVLQRNQLARPSTDISTKTKTQG